MFLIQSTLLLSSGPEYLQMNCKSLNISLSILYLESLRDMDPVAWGYICYANTTTDHQPPNHQVAQFYRASKTDLYTIYSSDRTKYSYRDRISDCYTEICKEIGYNYELVQIRSLL